MTQTQQSQGINKEQSLEKVRDILVGSQLRDYDGRFNRLENHLMGAIQSVRDEVRQRMDTIETSLLEEVRAGHQRIAQEQVKRQEALNTLENDMLNEFAEADTKQRQQSQKFNQQMEKKFQQIDGKVDKLEQNSLEAQQAIRQQVLERYKTVSDDIQQRVTVLENVMKEALAEQAHNKVDRNALSAMLMETALRLADEPEQTLQANLESEALADSLEQVLSQHGHDTTLEYGNNNDVDDTSVESDEGNHGDDGEHSHVEESTFEHANT